METKRLILAIFLSLLILLGFDYFLPPHAHKETTKAPVSAVQMADEPAPKAQEGQKVSRLPAQDKATNSLALKPSVHVGIKGEALSGSLDLRGARFDNIFLTDYRETLDKNSPFVKVLAPPSTAFSSFVTFGWKTPETHSLKLPDASSEWSSSATELSPGHPITLRWSNGEGQVFVIQVALNHRYLFDVTQTVENHGSKPISVVPYAQIVRDYKPEDLGGFLVHEGPLSVMNDRLNEESYKTLRKAGEDANRVAWTATSTGGWAGFTDKYWLTAVIADNQSPVAVSYRYLPHTASGEYLVEAQAQHAVTVAPGNVSAFHQRMFAGAKEVNLLDEYTTNLQIPYFYKAVDFGWFAFITRPMFHLLHWLYFLVGNFGIALMIMTLIIKLILYPLATKSFASMAKMRALAPRVKAIRESAAGDQMKVNQQTMALYREEGVNPAGGCLPLLIQAPVAFCLYKVLYITIEMRHAPFFGWIRDLSAPDPTNIFNLFGLLPFHAEAFSPLLHIGIWPVLFGFTIWLMQSQSTVTMDPAQQKIMQFMPILYTFFLGRLSAGIVIYYTWNNILSFGQQKMIQSRIDAAEKKRKTPARSA